MFMLQICKERPVAFPENNRIYDILAYVAAPAYLR